MGVYDDMAHDAGYQGDEAHEMAQALEQDHRKLIEQQDAEREEQERQAQIEEQEREERRKE